MNNLQRVEIEFAQVSNRVLNDPRLSLKAKGMFAYLYSKPISWQFSYRRIANDHSDGEKAVASSLQELEENGYLERKREFGGRISYFLKFDFSAEMQNGSQPKWLSAKTSPISNTKTQSNTELHSNKEYISKDIYAAEPHEHSNIKIILLKNEVMSNIDDRDRSFPRKRTYGDEKIDWTLDYLEYKTGLKLGGQERWNRIYAKHMTNKYGMKITKQVIDWISEENNWWSDKIGQMKTLYTSADRILKQMEKDTPIEDYVAKAKERALKKVNEQYAGN